MSQQNLDLRKSIQIVRRRKKLFGGVAALGLLIGAAYAVLTAAGDLKHRARGGLWHSPRPLPTRRIQSATRALRPASRLR